MNHDVQILRTLANEYAQLVHTVDDKTLWELHAGVNDLCPQRPIVLIDELPWHELNIDGSLSLHCLDPDFRQSENYLRQTLFHHKFFPGDMRIRPYLPIPKTIHSTGIGVNVKEEILGKENDGSIVSHRYENQFHSIEDVKKLHMPVITYDAETSNHRLWKIGEAIGDILPVKLVGEPTGYGFGHTAWDTISTFMSVDNLLFALVDEPEMMHALVNKLTDIFLDTLRQYEELNLIDIDTPYCHSSSAASNELAKEPVDYDHITAKNVWGRGLAQILATVSPAMHQEFEIECAKRALAPFGQVYYGCCEPLDTKIDIVKEIPNLRKISITPWADIHRASEAIGKNYVISAKPNPANLPFAASNPDLIRKELRTILTACKKKSDSVRITFKRHQHCRK